MGVWSGGVGYVDFVWGCVVVGLLVVCDVVDGGVVGVGGGKGYLPLSPRDCFRALLCNYREAPSMHLRR